MSTSSLASSYTALIPSRGSTSWLHLNLTSSPRPPSPNTISLGLGLLPMNGGGDNRHPRNVKAKSLACQEGPGRQSRLGGQMTDPGDCPQEPGGTGMCHRFRQLIRSLEAKSLSKASQATNAP